MVQPFNDFVNAVRLAETAEDEQYLLKTEEAQIRACLKKTDSSLRPRIVSKLVFLDMVGENTAWGQMEALTLMTDDRFSFKRVGYICASALLDQTTELTVLVTQTLLRDLKSQDPNCRTLALSFIANNGTSEVCRAVATEVQKLLSDSLPVVTKHAGMAAVRVVRTNADLADSFRNSVQSLLNSPVHGVIISGINMVVTLLHAEPKLSKPWSQFAIPFTRILKSLNQSRPTREFCYGVFNDPYMQVKTMQALAALGVGSEELEGILQTVISGTDTQRNIGRALLYQAVETVVAVSKKQSLRGLAFNQVGRLLSMRQPNVLYSALSSFARVLYSGDTAVNRGNVDSMALQRYKSQIVKCLDHQDPSIRRRALHVISALIDETNVESLIPEILAYVKLADSEFRSELVARVYAAAERFAPSKQWLFDVVHQILVDSGNYVSMDMVSSFCELVAKTGALHQYAVQKLGESIAVYTENQTLVQVAAFVIGEFAAVENGMAALLAQVIILPQTKAETKLYLITALAKMSVRFGTVEQTLVVLRGQMTDNNLEVQQRAGEFATLLGMDVSVDMFAPIASSAESEDVKQSIQIDATATPAATAENQAGNDLLAMMLQGKQPASPQPAASEDLLGLLGDVSTPPAANTPPAPPPKPVAAPPSPVQPARPVSGAPPAQGQPTGVELLRKNDFVIYGQTRANPADQRMVALKLIVVTTGSALSEFRLQCQVTPGWQMNPQPPDGNVVAPGKPVSQVIYLINTTNAPFLLNVRASYKFGAQPLTEAGSITTLPRP
jgi:hypothetical protein